MGVLESQLHGAGGGGGIVRLRRLGLHCSEAFGIGGTLGSEALGLHRTGTINNQYPRLSALSIHYYTE